MVLGRSTGINSRCGDSRTPPTGARVGGVLGLGSAGEARSGLRGLRPRRGGLLGGSGSRGGLGGRLEEPPGLAGRLDVEVLGGAAVAVPVGVLAGLEGPQTRSRVPFLALAAMVRANGSRAMQDWPMGVSLITSPVRRSVRVGLLMRRKRTEAFPSSNSLSSGSAARFPSKAVKRSMLSSLVGGDSSLPDQCR